MSKRHGDNSHRHPGPRRTKLLGHRHLWVPSHPINTLLLQFSAQIRHEFSWSFDSSQRYAAQQAWCPRTLLASFTPIYGQGMSVAALEALALRDCLTTGATHLAPRYFKRAGAIVRIAWTITVGNDRRLAPTANALPWWDRLIGWYLQRLQRAAHHDAALSTAFSRVGNLSAPPASLLRPSLAFRVFWGNFRPPHHHTETTDLRPIPDALRTAAEP